MVAVPKRERLPEHEPHLFTVSARDGRQLRGLVGGSVRGGVYSMGALGPNTAALRLAFQVPVNGLAELIQGQEYGAASVFIALDRTVGAGSCAGCFTPVSIKFGCLEVYVAESPSAPALTLFGPSDGSQSDLATWQGGGGPFPPPPGGCTGVVPVRSSTWGAVKALYR